MEIIKSVDAIKEIIREHKNDEESIGFVPTMGALHEGHIALARRSVQENMVTIMSIFVNPTQFNDADDLKKYPRNLEEDVRLLKYEKVDYVFAPETEDIYPKEDTRTFDFKGLDTVMEGKYREGHFNGVAQVVSKLLEIIPADRAYFGTKDFQQLSIVKYLVKNYMPDIETEIEAYPTVREKDGLAMSSRNSLLSKSERMAAPVIYETLSHYKTKVNTLGADEIKDEVVKKIDAHPLLTVEYFEIVNNESLQPVSEIVPGQTTGCIAVYAGKVRLIDNIPF
jgi:pantoate--beta-alanine ligase